MLKKKKITQSHTLITFVPHRGQLAEMNSAAALLTLSFCQMCIFLLRFSGSPQSGSVHLQIL